MCLMSVMVMFSTTILHQTGAWNGYLMFSTTNQGHSEGSNGYLMVRESTSVDPL